MLVRVAVRNSLRREILNKGSPRKETLSNSSSHHRVTHNSSNLQPNSFNKFGNKVSAIFNSSKRFALRR